MALTRNRVIKQVTLLPQENTIEVAWAWQVRQDGELVGELLNRRAYAADQVGLLDADLPPGVATRIKQAMGWQA